MEKATENFKTVTQKYNATNKNLNSLLIEYQAKKDYLDGVSKLYNDKGLKAQKNKYTGKVTSVTVPIDIWKSQQVLYSDFLATKAMKKSLEKKIAEIQAYLSDDDKLCLEEKITDLTKQLAEIEVKNRQLELYQAQNHEVFHENPGFEAKFFRTQQWMVGWQQ